MRHRRWFALVVLAVVTVGSFALPAVAQEEPSRPLVEARDRVLVYPPRGAEPFVCDGVTINQTTASTHRHEIDFRMEPILGPGRLQPSEHATTRVEVLSDARFDARGNLRAQPDWDFVLHHWNLRAEVGNGWKEMAFGNTYKMTPGLWVFRSTTTGDVSGVVSETLCLVEVVLPLTSYSAALAGSPSVSPAVWLEVAA